MTVRQKRIMPVNGLSAYLISDSN